MTATPPLKLRPKMDRWLRDRGFSSATLGARWGITQQGAGKYLLPFSDPRRVVPSEERMADALEWTAGEVTAADWFHPDLLGTGAAAQAEAAQ